MKILPSLSILALASLLAASSVHAQTADGSKVYAEFGYTATSFKASDTGISVKASPGLYSGTVGYQALPNLSVEAFLGFGAGKDKVKANGVEVPVSVKMGTMYGVFARPSLALNDSVEVFGRVGFVNTSLKTTAFGDSATEKDTSLAYGFGANFNLSKTSYLQASWTRFNKSDDAKVEGFGVAYGLRF